jgi:hypothetical protein
VESGTAASWKIVKKPITISAKAQTITYGGSIASNGGQVTASGLVGGHSIASIKLTASRSTAGSGTITPNSAVIKSGNAEYNIVDSTDGHETYKIKKGISCWQTSYSLIESSNADNNHRPYGSNEDAKMPRKGKGIERGMVIEMTPGLCAKHLDAGIKCG